MTTPSVAFQIRLTSTDSLATVTERVKRALGGEFGPDTTREFDPDEARQAALLGLLVHVIGDLEVADGDDVRYVVRGLVRPDVEAELDLDAPVIDISEFVLAVLHLVDDPGWYIPDQRELLAEAGL